MIKLLQIKFYLMKSRWSGLFSLC